MRLNSASSGAVLILVIGLWAARLDAMPNVTFAARLSFGPINAATKPDIAGSGSVTAVLEGSKLIVTGTFEGLRSQATRAQIHRAPKGIRGPAIFDLAVTNAQDGDISGTFELTPAEVEDLKNQRFYVQLDSERVPDANLWGWFFVKRP